MEKTPESMTDFRALCAELHAAVQLYTGQNPASAEIPSNELVRGLMDAMGATAAALSQPEPQGPTFAEVDDLCAEHSFVYDGGDEGLECVHALIVDALARWGRQ